MLAFSVNGIKESLSRLVDRFLVRVSPTIVEAKRKAAAECGAFALAESVLNCPISPTKKQYSATLKRKRRTMRKNFTPGTLRRSIAFEVLPSGDASVFVSKNVAGGSGWKYARYIHDEKGTRWWKRGAGTVAAGARADEKFIERAVWGNQAKFSLIFDTHIQRAMQSLGW